MNKDAPIPVFGARAAIRMRFTGDIKDLASKLASGLMLPEFRIGPREDPPHDVLGLAEALGWEVWLEHGPDNASYPYSLKMETSDSFREISSNRMHDLSPWLARYVSSVCKIESLIGSSP
ncbi:MAG: hypothetical protein JWP91_3029 [Fibrobacteres bacterium]|nr:hypothetical protein [Fibrobacterota bacterium]